MRAALSNSAGFGGHNVTLAVKRFADELFSEVTYDRVTGGHDQEGWSLGTHAAELAPLTEIPSLT